MFSFESDFEELGGRMYDLAAELFPICRSVTGPGVRDTLDRIRNVIPLDVHEVPTGTRVFDWTVPKEWSIRDAYVKDESGERVIDFAKSNLHVVNGSVPVRATLSWDQLKPKLHTLPERPLWVPYRTSFHSEDWGFCLSHDKFRQLDARGNRKYEVCIDSSLVDGSLTYGELLIQGESINEVLISTHVCHPSLANDNLSGIAVATYLAKLLREQQQEKLRYSYRFLFIPATIGAITWLSLNEGQTHRIKHGWILSVVGDAGSFNYKKSRHGNAPIDRAFELVLRQSGEPFAIHEFEPFGYDQRQYCSPGFNLPIGCLMRTPNGSYPEYHTSADNMGLLRAESLAGSLRTCLAVAEVLEGNATYRNLNPKCEPRLGPRGLYQAFGQSKDANAIQKAVLWVLNLSDGRHSLADIAERAGMSFTIIREAANLLFQRDLLAQAHTSSPSLATSCEGMRNHHEYCLL